MRKRAQAGITLLEVVVAMVITTIVGLAILQGIMTLSRQSQGVRNKAFAAEKVMQMLEELRGVATASGSGLQSLANLDNYDDGSGFNYVLTTHTEVTNPGDVTSGNGALKFKRRVTILHTNDPLSRMVYVRVFDASGSVLAEGASLMRTSVKDYYPTQVYDVYLLELENVPGWWTSLTTLRPTLDNVIQDLQNRNPGLELRIHYITRLAYGRDPFYTPYMNQAALASASPMPYVYFYPGLVGPNNNGANVDYYEPNVISGRYNLDNASYPNGAPTTPTPSLPSGYSLADQYNHAVRYPDEVALYAAATAAAAASGMPQPEISLRMLIEQLNTSTMTMKNSIILNAHGELLPLPPMRNYSDPAKDPLANPYVRAVAHPENLHYNSGSAVNLRVYAFSASTQAVPAPNNAVVSTITILLPYIALSPTPGQDISIRALRGAADPGSVFCGGSTHLLCQWFTPTACTPGVNCSAGNSPGQYSITNPTPGSTLITLYGSPLYHPYGTGPGGAGNSAFHMNSQLYGLEYVPGPPLGTVFAEGTGDLTIAGTGPKNTASWVITFLAGRLTDGQATFETRIGEDTTTGCPNAIPVSGSAWCSNDPPNLSRTYAWLGSLANPADAPPATEQFQFLGDPAHMPYADVKSSAGYNWYFGQPGNNNNGHGGYLGYPNISNTGWTTGEGRFVNVDLPRFYQVLRQGLLKSNGLWTTMNGWSYYYYGLGGEMGFDGSNNFNNGLEIQQRPWNTTSAAACAASCGGACTVNEITDEWSAACYSYTYTRLIASTDRTWISLPWIGELYPDSQYAANWSQFGNLPTAGAAADSQHFFRDQPASTYGLIHTTTFTFAVPTYVKMPAEYGCSSFLNAEVAPPGSNKWFMHDSGTFNNNPITQLGITQTSALNYPVPTTLTATRPFRLDNTAVAAPPEWNNAVYSTQRGTSTFLNTVAAPPGVTYQSTDGGNPSATFFTSGFVKVATTSGAAYFVVSGLATQGNFGTVELGEFALTSMVYDYLQAGDPVNNPTARVTQLPLVSVQSPAVTAQLTNPSAINVVWTSVWTRWDGQAYTPTYPGGFTEAITSTYNLKYSKNDGKTWSFVQDNAPAAVGVLDTSAAHAIPNTTTSYAWNVSNAAAFPMGNYILRVEQYRNDFPQHYAYHSRPVYISR
jgi:type II secretory pathway pseudopilin PulG